MAINKAERRARFRRRKKAGRDVVLSEGDSWFSYELFSNIIDLIDNRSGYAHLRLETSGDTVENMIGSPTSIESLREDVEEETAIFMLFSGGGNDIQRASDDGLFQNGAEPADCLIPEKVDALFSMLQDRYEALIQSVGPVAPVVGHGYDRFQPMDTPVHFFGVGVAGPWIYPNMVAVGIEDPEKQKAIVDIMIDRFNSDLLGLQGEYPDDFVYIDLRGTLIPVDDWENEIHPTRDGFKKVANKVWSDIQSRVLPLLTLRSEGDSS